MVENQKTLPQLRGLIVEKFGNQSTFAKALNWPDATLSYKLCNPGAITIEDALTMAELLGIELSVANLYLFLS